jgi:hypothetical protein
VGSERWKIEIAFSSDWPDEFEEIEVIDTALWDQVSESLMEGRGYCKCISYWVLM